MLRVMKRVSLFVVAAFVASVSSSLTALATFADTYPQSWYASDLSTAVRQGWVEGYQIRSSDGARNFGPDDPVTAAQAAKIAVLAAGGAVERADCAGCHWASSYIAVLERGAFPVRWDAPDRAITRSEAAAIVATAFRLTERHDVHHRDIVVDDQLLFPDDCVSYDVRGQRLPFVDLNASQPFCAAVVYLKSRNVLHGAIGSDGEATSRL
jgi:hypothetical protein